MIRVIIPAYKARGTICKGLDSLVAQTKPLFMTTIVQDGDGEDYTDIVEEYQRRGLHLNLLSLPENVGPGGARQAGMDADTQSDFFMFMDADDMFMPRAVEVLGREIMTTNSDIVTSSFIREQKASHAIVLEADKTSVTWFHGKIYRASYLREKNIRFLPDLRLNEDAYFNLVAWNSADKKIRCSEITYLWRDNEHSLTREGGDRAFFEKSYEGYIYAQVQGLIDLYERASKVMPELTAATLLHCYGFMMRAIHYNLPIEGCHNLLRRLDGNKVFTEQIQSINFWQYIEKAVKSCASDTEGLYFFKERFIDWFNIHVRGM